MAEGERACPSCGRSFGADVLFCPTDGVPLASRSAGSSLKNGPDPYLGIKLLGQIEIKKLAGVGSMARVYRAFQHGIEREVAVKILHRELSSNPEIIERFHREARVASKVVHPNVVQVLLTAQLPADHPQVGGELALVMEYLDGMSLLSALRASGGALALPRALHIALQICDAVGEAHELGVVHRDLKPENVMLVRRGDDPDFVKVLDFGLARLNTRDASYATRAGAIFGSPRYISPEGAQGLPVEAPADVYAIATVLYQCLAGRTPFEAESAVGFLLAHANEIPPKLNTHERASYVPGPLVELLDRCLAKRPEDRPADARRLGRQLLEAAQRSGLRAESLLGGAMTHGGISSLAQTREQNLVALELGTPLSTGTLADPEALAEPVSAPPLAKASEKIPGKPPTLPPSIPSLPSSTQPAARQPPELVAEASTSELLAAVASSGVAPTLFDEPLPAPSSLRDRELSSPSQSEEPSSGAEPAPASSLPLSSSPEPLPLSPVSIATPVPFSSSLPTPPPSLATPFPEEPLHEPSLSAHRSPWPMVLLISACFGIGAIVAFAGANRLGMLGSRPAVVSSADTLLAQARDASAPQVWDGTSGQNVYTLLDRGRSEFPADPRFVTELRRVSVDITMSAVKERSAGRNDEAIRLAQLALLFDSENTVAAGIASELLAQKDAPIASVSPPSKSPRPPQNPVQNKRDGGSLKKDPPATKTTAPAERKEKGDTSGKDWL